MKNSNETIGNQTRVVPRIFVTNILRYLLYFTSGCKPFELKRLVIFVFVCVYRTQLSLSIDSISAVLCLVIPDCQKYFEAKLVLRTKHDGKHILFLHQLLHPTMRVFNGSIRVGYTKEIQEIILVM